MKTFNRCQVKLGLFSQLELSKKASSKCKSVKNHRLNLQVLTTGFQQLPVSGFIYKHPCYYFETNSKHSISSGTSSECISFRYHPQQNLTTSSGVFLWKHWSKYYFFTEEGHLKKKKMQPKAGFSIMANTFCINFGESQSSWHLGKMYPEIRWH